MVKDKSEHVIYLHGDLDLKIIAARSLPNMDLVSEHLRRCFASFDMSRLPLRRRKGHKVSHHKKKIITSDPYVTVCLAGATVARTRVIPNSQDPVWNERFMIPVAHPVSEIEFYVKDNDMFGADLIGVATVSAADLLTGETISDWFTITSSYGKPPKPDCAVRLEMKFSKCDDIPLYRYGMALDPDGYGVKGCYFPVRRGCAVKLYQDAHVRESEEMKIELEQGKVYERGKCWEDICHAILEAHHLIYIVGWSVFHKIRLVREPTRPLPNGGDLSLGDLLKYKTQEGVRVLLLVWDDKTSHSKFGINTEGVMQTHDEEIRKFFKHSSVSCVLAPRYASSKLSIFKQQVVGTLFTHHQKCVILDTQAPGNNRKISVFLGGLDLCDGRYDTPDHRLFRDLDTVFADDFHNPTITGAKGPRQPWHDLHCRVDGPAAYDILKNFEQRWRKVKKLEFGQRFKRAAGWNDDSLIKLERISWILTPSALRTNDDPALWVTEEIDNEKWHVQVFRSVDSGSVKGFPKDPSQAESENLVCAKSLVIDRSIQTAYIQAIRAAQHFIYIENQYFVGSSYAWPSSREAGADNLVPIELALKIASKIRAKERFAVYVVIPMWPEGVPSSASVQQILFWQRQTMKMMYKIIADELNFTNITDCHPQDYLNFYCLGNREELPENMAAVNKSPSTSSNGEVVSASQTSQRFMIYVHAKGMIVDDEYVMLGSANINQRSLAGSRDTEIAVGAFQPHCTWGRKQIRPQGQVYGYRMSLWAEHTGMLEDSFKEPESLECVKRVNEIAEENWMRFMNEKFTKLQGHLLKYPVHIDADGAVTPIPGQEIFPDVGGKILGSRTTLPDALTT